MAPLLRWRHTALRAALAAWLLKHFRFTYDTLERSFQERPDPWGFATSRYEQERFRKMLALLLTVPHDTVLEIGCAEGHFTAQLVQAASAVTALDLSSLAIGRAKQRAPQATYLTTRVEAFHHIGPPFDVVVCSEMLYYLPDTAVLIPRLAQLGRHLVTSNCNQFSLLMEHKLRRYQLVRRAVHLSVGERKFSLISLWRL
jgi:2-polyprenyl-3-methyl-5-hydroxy-6-metoxy-1,4-benzoquinol methylase